MRDWIHLLWNSILSYLPLYILTHISLNLVSLLTIQFQFSKTDFCSVRMTDQAQMHRTPIYICKTSCTVPRCMHRGALFVSGRPQVSDLRWKSIRCKEKLRRQTSDKMRIIMSFSLQVMGGRKQIRWNEEAGWEPLSGEEVATLRRQNVRALCGESEFWLDEYRKPHFCQDHFGQWNTFIGSVQCGYIGQNVYFV